MKIIYEPMLSERTSIRLGGKAIAELRLTELEEVFSASDLIKQLGGNVFILGGGTNILASDENLPLVLLKNSYRAAPEIVHREQNNIWVTVGTSFPMPRFLAFCAKQGLSGLEGLSGIPGSVGGAIAMNAGSFGTQTCEHLESINLYSENTGIIKVNSQEFFYGYREFKLKKSIETQSWFLLLEATFILTLEEMSGITKERTLDYLKKKSRQPIKDNSAGCVFKNPAPDKPAGLLLEKCGFKGKRLGGMQFSPIHANFLINTGMGTSEEAFQLIAMAKEKVQEEFGLVLQTEVKILCP